jgi:hypothetical protein
MNRINNIEVFKQDKSEVYPCAATMLIFSLFFNFFSKSVNAKILFSFFIFHPCAATMLIFSLFLTPLCHYGGAKYIYVDRTSLF